MRSYKFCFESYGVPIRISADSAEVLEKAVATARSALLERFLEINCTQAKQRFHFQTHPDGTSSIIQNGETMTTGNPSDFRLWRFFDSLVRILVAEHAKSVVFVHAGVVGWRERAIVLPGSSFWGKTTLVAELVKCGASYYSDEYAVFDEAGLVHAFPRNLSLRTDGENNREDIPIEKLGGKSATAQVRVACVLFAKYENDSDWNPQFLTVGQGMMEILPQTIAIRRNTKFAINVLKKAIGNAIIVKSARPDAVNFARDFLEFVDNTAF